MLGATKAASESSVSGSFSAMALQGTQGSGSPLDKLARTAIEAKKTADESLEEQRNITKAITRLALLGLAP